MSRIKLGSPMRSKKRPLSSYASFALFVTAAAIALSALVMRVGKDRLTETADDAFPSASRQTVSTRAAIPDGSGTEEASTTQQTSPAVQNRTKATTRKAAKDENDDFDEFEDREDSEETLAIQVMGNARSYVRPSGGAIIKPCSLKQLAYSRTMKDWRIHTGLDIAAEKGEIVKSAGEGKVTDITNDSLYGTTVVVNQNDGLMVYYRGLNKDTAVRQGENVAEGASIGTVGEIPCEAADGIHLHIEVRSENRYLDPAEALGIK